MTKTKSIESSIFDWITKQFGEGKIRVEGECTQRDGTLTGFACKVDYVGSLGTVSEKDILSECVNSLRVEQGATVTKLRIVGICGTTTEQGNFTKHWFYPKS